MRLGLCARVLEFEWEIQDMKFNTAYKPQSIMFVNVITCACSVMSWSFAHTM